MNDQMKGFVRIVLGWGGGLLLGYLVAHGADQAQASSAISNAINAIIEAIPAFTAFISAVAPAAALVWSAVRHTEAGNVVAASGAAGVTVHVDPVTASHSVLQVARDDSVENVVVQKPGA